MVINQGDVYWLYLREPSASEPGYKHPHVVVQNNLFNRSQIGTVLVCALTSNLKRASAPGNVLLAQGEANLPKPSVVNVAQLLTADKTQLGESIGTLSTKRVQQVLDGIRLPLEPREID